MSGERCGLAGALIALLTACSGQDQPPGQIEGSGRSTSSVASAARQQAKTRGALGGGKRVLFGDLHVHTTYSVDALVFSLPLLGGEGTHPPADACDYARYCSALDFFSINDHAEGLTPDRWAWTKESLRHCNAKAGAPRDPDLVGFVGWEWTQVGKTPETHYGHKNVIFRGLDEEELPARPITALPGNIMARAPDGWMLRAPQLLAPFGLRAYADFLWLIQRLAELPNCEEGIDTRKLPTDCRENAPTPAELFAKLDQWGFETLVIPHGLAWGLHAPPGARIDNQLSGAQHDASRQRLIEIASGHGNSEEYRNASPFALDDDGTQTCPAPTRDFLPCCWRAGEIMRERCGDLPASECERRIEEARRLALEASTSPHLIFPDTDVADWLDCDQCRDCFKPAFNLRPGETAQYAAAITRFEGGEPRRFRWGFIASSDDHEGRAATGFKQVGRRRNTDARGIRNAWQRRLIRPFVVGRQVDPQRAQAGHPEPRSFASLLDVERVASFMYPGGVVAVHADGRDRRSIWRALERRETYGTSGPRILLWFDLLNGPNGRAPMGSEVVTGEVPRFEVRTAGDFVQLPGCPEESLNGLSAERLQRLCRGECYHPSDRRHPITGIEVVRIRPQTSPGEDVSGLIDDPWRSFTCSPDPQGCVVRFEDPDYSASGRDAVYYVRALQEATPAINGANYRTEFDDAGNALRTRPCYGDDRTSPEDDCLAPVQERAWSSPIYLDQPRAVSAPVE